VDAGRPGEPMTSTGAAVLLGTTEAGVELVTRDGMCTVVLRWSGRRITLGEDRPSVVFGRLQAALAGPTGPVRQYGGLPTWWGLTLLDGSATLHVGLVEDGLALLWSDRDANLIARVDLLGPQLKAARDVVDAARGAA